MNTNVEKYNNTKNIKKILDNFDYNLINLEIVSENVSILKKLYLKIKKMYMLIDDSEIQSCITYNLQDSKISSSIYKHINSFVNLVGSTKLKKLVNYDKLLLIDYENIKLYYPYKNDKDMKKDIVQIIKLIKISICLNKLFCPNDTISRVIIWLPTNSNRDFDYEQIDSQTIQKSIDNFNAFTVSGLTYGGISNPRYTIISRYEEIEKLLIHELIHNYYIDGCSHHSHLKNTISEYKNKKSSDNHDYEYSIYESYTELMSTYIFLIFQNINLPNEQIEKKLLGQIITEIIYSYNLIVNLIKLNNYKNLEDFMVTQSFKGTICFYEYYYLKGLMYNHFKICLPQNLQEFNNMYKEIIKIIKKAETDNLLKYIFNKNIKQKNFKYIYS